MSDKKKIRLSALTRTYSVGVHHLVEHLNKKGLGDGVNPNTILSDQQLASLKAEFGGQEVEKVDIREIIRSTNTTAKNAEAETKVVEPVVEEISKVEAPKINKPKVLGKIDLSKPAKKVEIITEKQEVAVVKETPKVEEVKIEAPKEVEPIVVPVEKPQQEVVIEKVEEKTEVKAPAVEVKLPEVKEEVKIEKVEDRKEEKPKTALFRANEKETLAGPKILGKIELPVATPSGGRGKRNRIKKNKVDIKNVQTSPNNNNKQGGGGASNNTDAKPNHNHNNEKRAKNKPQRPARVAPVKREQVSEEDVQKQIKETLARLTNKGSKTKASKHRRDKRDAVQERMAEAAQQQQSNSGVLQVTEFVTVSELATMMDKNIGEIITACMNLGLMVSINQRLDAEALVIVAEEFGYKVEFVSVEIQEAIDQDEDREEDLVPRPPIVTVMGHVDHGKTSLLDYIRNANVIAGEAGGITQHIGAYSVKLEDGRRVTFLDTPGHEAFTAMRARGAKVTDVAVIIVAADDAIMPQTKEAINHAEAAGVPMVFAINKVDKDGANPDKIKEQLSMMNYLVEDWGGKYQSEDISAKKGLNIDKLLEKIVLESEILDLKANPKRKAMGSVIESTLDKGRGYVTTVLVQNGTLRVGDVMLSGIYTGRVKAMFNERGVKVDEAGPATPVLVLGLNGAPQAGDLFNIMDDDKSAREIATKREQLQRMQGLRTQKHITLDEIGRRIAIGSFKELNIIIKGDVDGSIEALTDSLLKLTTEEVQVNVIHKAVGAISESDVLLAAASNAVIVGFQVRPSAAARKLAEKEEIDIRLYSIIYDAINEIKDAIEGMLAPESKEEVTASVEVLETFKISKVGTIAGCIVREGKIHKGNSVRVIRDGIVVYTGKLAALKRFKDEVKEVGTNLECGLSIENYNDIKVGDVVESYIVVEVARKL